MSGAITAVERREAQFFPGHDRRLEQLILRDPDTSCSTCARAELRLAKLAKERHLQLERNLHLGHCRSYTGAGTRGPSY